MTITKREVALRTLGGLLALLFLVAAGMKFAAVPFEANNFAHFGYAPWFMDLIGAVELVGAVLLVVPRWSGVGAAAMVPIMIGAVGSHLRAGDGVGMATPALVALLLLIVVAMARRHSLLGLRTVMRPLQAA
jgi:putative oxidoreductase